MKTASFWLAALCLLAPSVAHAYVGPGAGISAVGSLLALVAAVIVAIFGFLWFPIKRLMRKKKAAPTADDVSAADAASLSAQDSSPSPTPVANPMPVSESPPSPEPTSPMETAAVQPSPADQPPATAQWHFLKDSALFP